MTDAAQRPITNENAINLYMHCGRCLESRPATISPQNWARLEVGWTELGIQVWCKRHNCNVVHIDFQDQKHPANLTRKRGLSEKT